MKRGHDATLQALWRAMTSRGGLGDRGAVAVEFALIVFPMLLLLSGIFGVGVVMVQYMQLNFVVENAATLQAVGGNGMAYATTQLQPPASFTSTTSTACGVGVSAAQFTGTWPVTLGIFDAITVTLSASATACPPTPPPPPPTTG